MIARIVSGSRSTALRGAVVGLALLAAAPGASGQEEQPPAAPLDTAQVTGEPQEALPRDSPVSPGGALLRSIIVPGWGQIAAEQPARGAIYFTVWSGGVFMILKTNAEVNAAKRAEDEELVDERKGAREDWILFTGLWALLSGIDAWISAQFAGFEGEVRPPQDGSPGIEFSYPVKIF